MASFLPNVLMEKKGLKNIFKNEKEFEMIKVSLDCLVCSFLVCASGIFISESVWIFFLTSNQMKIFKPKQLFSSFFLLGINCSFFKYAYFDVFSFQMLDFYLRFGLFQSDNINIIELISNFFSSAFLFK